MRLTITPERAARIKLWILIPTRELRCLSPHHVTLLGTLRQHGIWYSLRTLPGDSLVTRARNNLADIFLHESTSDDDHFCLWLDDDILFSPDSILEMLALDRDFVSAPYTRKGLHMDRMAAAARRGWASADLPLVSGTPNVNFLINQISLAEPMPVLESGSGLWLTKRKVYRQMVDALPGIRYRRTADETAHYGRDYAYDFFRVGVWPETSEYLSEDWWFCREWRRLGGTVWCCFWIQTQHVGTYCYPLNMDAILGLLHETGGVIHGPTEPKETIHDTTKAGPNGHGASGDRLAGALIQASQAAIAGGAGPLGAREGD